MTDSDGSRDRYFKVNGLNLHVTLRGESTLPTVLLVHGVNVQLHTWDPIATRLCDRFCVVSVDLRGHGDSDWTRAGYRLVQFVEDITELIAQMEFESFSYVGHSLGALIGILLASSCPAGLTHLALSDAGPELSREGLGVTKAKGERASAIRGFATESEARAFFVELYPGWQPEFYDLHVKYQLRRNWAGKLVFKVDPEVFWVMSSAGIAGAGDLWEASGRISVPTLIMRGIRSHLLSEEAAARMLTVIPRARMHSFDTAHQIARERPTEFAKVLGEFLES